MADLTETRFFHCSTAEEWQTTVQGFKGSYVVRWDNHSHLRTSEVQYDYSCDCKAYQFGKGKYCKHIEQVRKGGNHCNWSQFEDGGEPTEKDGKKFCPKCGETAKSMLWGV